MLKCQNCNNKFPNKIKDKAGTVHHLAGRKFCPDCSPLGGRNTRSYIINLSAGEAFCARCTQVKDKKHFYIRKNGAPFSYCMKCQDEVKKLKFEENLERIVDSKAGNCADCQFSYPVPVYEFYNNGKTYPISKIKNMSIDKLLKELRNYEMLCKNCAAIRKWERS